MSVVINVDNVGKKYLLGHQKRPGNQTIQEALIHSIQSVIQRIRHPLSLYRKNIEIEEFWALKGVNFSIQRGERVGIIGCNGAGKTTLLKILSRITHPTTGRVHLKGRVASLLQVGTGFHPELTGRENIYLNGAILGMTRQEIRKKFDEIVDFSEVENFLDTPVKRYSSGMYVRLAFAVAAHLEPEVLLVDEVLAVGDASFQKKCLGKMSHVANEGRTVLFVSHNMLAIQHLCNRVLWLNKGLIMDDGEPEYVISQYLKTSFSTITEQVWDDIRIAPGNHVVRLHRACIRPENGSPSDPIAMQKPLVVEYEFWNLIVDVIFHLNYLLLTEEGIVAFSASTGREPDLRDQPLPKGLFRSSCYIPGDLLKSGMHRIVLRVFKDNSIIYQYDDILIFDVKDTDRTTEFRGWYGKGQGVVRPKLKWTRQLLTSSPKLEVPKDTIHESLFEKNSA